MSPMEAKPWYTPKPVKRCQSCHRKCYGPLVHFAIGVKEYSHRWLCRRCRSRLGLEVPAITGSLFQQRLATWAKQTEATVSQNPDGTITAIFVSHPKEEQAR